MLDSWAYSIGTPVSTAVFKASPQDFEVHEFFDYSFSGEGEHQLLHIEKKGCTTEEVVKALAQRFDIPTKFISYAGLKDRQSLSTQWFSLHMPGHYPDALETVQAPGWRVLKHCRHHKKLRPGYLAGNQFIIRLRQVESPEAVEQRFWQLMQLGVPNYFGEQRFGRDGQNIQAAEAFLSKRKKVKSSFLKGIYCSTARSLIFNRILSARIDAGNWKSGVNGDVMQLQGSHSIFLAETIDDILQQRIRDSDISPASPLYGHGKMLCQGEALSMVHNITNDMQSWCEGLERQKLSMDWRAHILYPSQPSIDILENEVTLTFSLPAGSYATSVLRELVSYPPTS